MTTTAEEALEQGWLEPAPTFFGNDGEAQDFFGKCYLSPWVLVRRTDPKPVPDEAHPAVIAMRDAAAKRRLPLSQKILDHLPHIEPRPRPFTYLYLRGGA